MNKEAYLAGYNADPSMVAMLKEALEQGDLKYDKYITSGLGKKVLGGYDKGKYEFMSKAYDPNAKMSWKDKLHIGASGLGKTMLKPKHLAMGLLGAPGTAASLYMDRKGIADASKKYVSDKIKADPTSDFSKRMYGTNLEARQGMQQGAVDKVKEKVSPYVKGALGGAALVGIPWIISSLMAKKQPSNVQQLAALKNQLGLLNSPPVYRLNYVGQQGGRKWN